MNDIVMSPYKANNDRLLDSLPNKYQQKKIQKEHEAILNGKTVKAFGLAAEVRTLGLLNFAGHTLLGAPVAIISGGLGIWNAVGALVTSPHLMDSKEKHKKYKKETKNDFVLASSAILNLVGGSFVKHVIAPDMFYKFESSEPRFSSNITQADHGIRVENNNVGL
jgi:hypothetical protein